MARKFQVIALTLPGFEASAVAIAATRAGEWGVLDLEHMPDRQRAHDAIRTLASQVKRSFGVKVNGDEEDFLADLASDFPSNLKLLIFASQDPRKLSEQIGVLKQKGLSVLLEATSFDQAKVGEELGVDGIIAKGNECGGRVEGETTFILLQRFLSHLNVPVFAQGGIGMHTAAACAAAGAAGVVLDAQLALTRESSLPPAIKEKIAAMDGGETLCIGELLQDTWRVYFRPGCRAVEELQRIEKQLVADERPRLGILADWHQAIRQRVGWSSAEENVLLLGQDGSFAASLAERCLTVGGVIQELKRTVREYCQAVSTLRPLDEGAPLAQSHGTRYPIMQGPMTRVSDVPEFAARVAEGGALPFLALALLKKSELQTLLAQTQQRLGAQPWGVGILGFIPPELRQEQLEVIREYRPPFALIAGGSPDQARSLEQQGIPAYLHVPSPGLLKMFLDQGARRFVFEGRECGGHVGPRTSFVLWNQMIDVLLAALANDGQPGDFHIVFAAGIHDSLSAAMVAVLAAPLAQRGARIGVLVGSAYLFTEEAVASGAILKGFQRQALKCSRTALLETGPGHTTRCAETPFVATFEQEKGRLLRDGASAEQIRMVLEELNLGRLRIASKGIARSSKDHEASRDRKFVTLKEQEQAAQGMYMIGQVAALRTKVCKIEELHRDIAVESSKMLAALSEDLWKTPSFDEPLTPSDIAIVGMACLLPKAPDVQSYWENILNKVDAITEIPKERWNWELFFDSDRRTRDKIYSKWGGFLDDVPFDPVEYGMPPASLRSIEPAQLLTLEAVRAALNDAGYLKRSFPRERTSVILGAGGGAADLGLSYGNRTFLPVVESMTELGGDSQNGADRVAEILPEWTEDSFAGILTNVSAGRVANRFDLGGTNCTVDAACASSLAAVSMGVRELETNHSDMVIVGGVDTMQNPFTYMCFSKTQALSPRGRCRTFDESADGIAISEGIAVMVLKRLADAERDGDCIYAVIKGTGASSDGKDRGLTAPRPEGQARALLRAYAKANVSPATVGLIEAHGTGTVAGDRAEVQALTKVFSEAEARRQGCAIGSVKSMIGHTKCTAGAAGLIKASLALYHKVLPPTLGVEKPNSNARFPETPFFVNTEPRPWIRNAIDHPRRAGVSAFGFGGTNFHVVMEEYNGDVVSSRAAPLQKWPGELFLWKGNSRSALLKDIDFWEESLASAEKTALSDLAYTAWKQMEERSTGNGASRAQLALIAASVDDLKQKLGLARQALAGDSARLTDPRGLYFSETPLAPEAKLAFLFPGQGSQYPNMVGDLAIHFPEVRESFDLADQVLSGRLEKPLSDIVFPPPCFNPDDERLQQQALTQTNVAQPAIGAASTAVFRLLQELGLEPDMVAGHSYGEYTALAMAGAFSREALVALSEARGRFIVEAAGREPGIMAAIEADAETVSKSLEGFEGVCIANSNAPRQTVISGEREAVERAVGHFAAQGTTARVIPVACAFHSHIVAPAQARLAEFLSTVRLAEPRITVFSNTTAAPYPTQPQALAERLVEHLVRPVEFAREIEAMYEAGARIFVEVGPGSVLTRLVDQILGDRPKLAVASNQKGRPGLVQLLHLLGQLVVDGVTVRLDRLYQGRSVRRVSLDALEQEYAQKPFSPTTWLVNGGRARPANEAPMQVPRNMPQNTSSKPLPIGQKVNQNNTPGRYGSEVTAPSSASSSPVLPGEAISQSAAQLHQGQVPGMPGVEQASAVLHGDGMLQVMAQYQQMMTRFLEVQNSLMLSYLGSASGAMNFDSSLGVPAAAGGFGIPDQIHGAPFTSTAPEAPIPVAEEPAVRQSPATLPEQVVVRSSSPVDKQELTRRFLEIVSERTGYPAEMLNPELDLEADLGIDSIKRVEILGNLQQSFSELARTEGMMEKLSGVKTLQGIIDRVVEQLGAQPAPQATAPVAPQPPAVAAAGPDKEELTARLLGIVSERTGYPPEMLNPELDLEADLGIDSIKRVEILGNLQQSFSELARTEGMMEKLSGVKTLQGIIDRVVEQLSAQPAPQATAPVAPQPPAVAAARPDKEELTARLLGIVSERTGYPPEMLNPELDLEADLGIDSIKRVEILGNLQQSFSELARTEGMMEKLSGVKTLQGIIDKVVDGLSVTQEARQVKAATDDWAVKESTVESADAGAVFEGDRSVGQTGQIQRFALEAVEVPLNPTPRHFDREGVILVTDDERGVAVSLAEKLRSRDYKVAMVRCGSGVLELGEGDYSADLGSSDAIDQLVKLVRQRQGALGGIIHLLPLQSGASFPEMDLKSWRERLRFETKCLFYLAKAAGGDLGKTGRAGGALLLAATGMGGAFMHSSSPKGTPCFPGQAGAAGLVKTLSLERPEVRAKAVDLNSEESATDLAEVLLQEFEARDDQVEVGYDGRRRIILAPKPAPLDPSGSPAVVLDRSSVILVTGGARGITAQAACRLAERYQPTLLILGRSPLPAAQEPHETAGLTEPKELKAALMDRMRKNGESVMPALVEKAYAQLMAAREIRSNLAAMERAGATVHYYQTDVRDEKAFGERIDEIYEGFGRLDGVIHGAGIIEDKLVHDKTPESFDRVFDTKVDSAYLLTRKLRPDSLKFIVFFSSVAGRFGNRGQSDYAAANEVLNKLALYLDRRWAGRVVSINWGPWEAGGMVSPEIRRQFAERGVELIPEAVGLRMFEEELNFGNKGDVEIVVGGGGWQAPQEWPQASQDSWPLIGQIFFSHTNGSVELAKILDPAHDLYLSDHRLNGQPVLPLAVATELMAEVVSRRWPEMQVVAVKDLYVLQGVVIRSGSETVRVIATPRAGATREALTVDVEIRGPKDSNRIHYRAAVELARALPKPPAFESLTLTEERFLQMNIDDLYRRWLFHGPVFQGITRVDQLGANGIKAALMTSSPREWFSNNAGEHWLIDPLMLDSGLQLLILWAREHWDMTTLPSRFQVYRRFGMTTGKNVSCEVRIRPNTGGHTIHADIFFLDDNGRVLGILEDIEGSCSKELNRLVGHESADLPGRGL